MIAKRSLDILKEGTANQFFSGAGFALISKKRQSGIGTLGRLAFDPESDRVNRDTLFDVASLTKPLATAMTVLQLADDGKLTLSQTLDNFFPGESSLTDVTIQQLLTHTSGLPSIPSYSDPDVITSAKKSELVSKPGQNYLYSDTGYILLGEIVRIISGKTLDIWFHEKIASPLYLKHSGFKPDVAMPIVATSDDESLDGLPHDERAREMGSVAGHAGLFMSTDDLAAYARALLGTGKALLTSETFDMLFKNMLSSEVGSTSSSFFMEGNPYMPNEIGFSDSRVGHSGFTGCFMLIDRKTETSICLLTNRVLNSTKEQSEFLQWRNQWLRAAAEDLGVSCASTA